MKYKAGSKIKIKSWKKMEKEFGLTVCGNINCKALFLRSMEHDLPKSRILVVEEASKYDMKCFDYSWSITPDMIAHKIVYLRKSFVKQTPENKYYRENALMAQKYAKGDKILEAIPSNHIIPDVAYKDLQPRYQQLLRRADRFGCVDYWDGQWLPNVCNFRPTYLKYRLNYL